MRAYACICVHMHVYACICVHMRAYACICVHMHVYECLCMHVHAHACIRRHIHAGSPRPTRRGEETITIACGGSNPHPYIYMHIYIYAYIYTYIEREREGRGSSGQSLSTRPDPQKSSLKPLLKSLHRAASFATSIQSPPATLTMQSHHLATGRPTSRRAVQRKKGCHRSSRVLHLLPSDLAASPANVHFFFLCCVAQSE